MRLIKIKSLEDTAQINTLLLKKSSVIVVKIYLTYHYCFVNIYKNNILGYYIDILYF